MELTSARWTVALPWPRPDATAPATPGEPINLLFKVGGLTYRLRRIATAWFATFDELTVPPREASEILKSAAAQHREDLAIAVQLETAASQLEGLHVGGIYVVLRVQPRPTAVAAVPSPPMPPPIRTQRQKAPVEPPPPAVEEPAMATAQADVLKNAARSGAPFCEECARAAAVA